MSEFNINHEINRIPQPSTHSCWAACLAMFCETAYRTCYTIPEIISLAKKQGVVVKANGALDCSRDNMAKLELAFRICILPNLGKVKLYEFVPYLTRAPIILFGAFSYSDSKSPINHAVILGGMWGDGSESTGLSIIDPQRTSKGYDSVTDDVFSWKTLCTQVITRLDFVGVIR